MNVILKVSKKPNGDHVKAPNVRKALLTLYTDVKNAVKFNSAPNVSSSKDPQFVPLVSLHLL